MVWEVSSNDDTTKISPWSSTLAWWKDALWYNSDLLALHSADKCSWHFHVEWVLRKALSKALRSTAFGAFRINRLSVEWGMMRVYLLRSTDVFCLPIACCRIGCQFAFSLSLAFLHDVVPRGPDRLLM
jgi:hypothetical protein